MASTTARRTSKRNPVLTWYQLSSTLQLMNEKVRNGCQCQPCTLATLQAFLMQLTKRTCLCYGRRKHPGTDDLDWNGPTCVRSVRKLEEATKLDLMSAGWIMVKIQKTQLDVWKSHVEWHVKA